MALNWTMLKPNDRMPVPHPNKMTITSVDSGVDLSLVIPDELPTGPSQLSSWQSWKYEEAQGDGQDLVN